MAWNPQEDILSFKPRCYFTKLEIEEHSPSRKDGIGSEKESHLRHLYCSYLQELGMELKEPQVTIATSMMFCHRFYMHQSHAKNHWQTVANASMFLACKTEDTPRLLKDLIAVAYKLMYSRDPLAPQRIKQKEVYDKQKELICLGERLILATVAFDFNIDHPYKPLVAALKKLEMPKEVVKIAWNFVNDWLRTTLCLQYKPHYIAAGSIYLAAKFQKIKLPSENGKVWWMQFDVSPKQLEEVIQHMLQLLGQSSLQKEIKPVSVKRKHESTDSSISNKTRLEQDLPSNQPSKKANKTAEETVNCQVSNSSGSANSVVEDGDRKIKRETTDSPISNKTRLEQDLASKQPSIKANKTAQETAHCQVSNSSGSANSGVEDADNEVITEDTNKKPGCKIVSNKEISQKIDIIGIRERLKRRKLDRVENKKQGHSLENDINSEAWIECEIENGIELV